MAPIATGGHHYLIVQAEKNGVWGAISAVQLTVDNAAPELTVKASPAITNGTGSVPSRAAPPTATSATPTSSAPPWSLDGGPATDPAADAAVVTPVDISVPVAGLAPGPHTVALTATDSFGNTSAPLDVQVTVDPTPPVAPA